jgi:hypothetical protein
MLNQGWSGVTHGVWFANVSNGARDAAAATDADPDLDARVASARPGAPTVPRREETATASVQRAARAQRVDTRRG